MTNNINLLKRTMARRSPRLELAILLYGVVVFFFTFLLVSSLPPVSADCGLKLETVLCQAAFYPNYTAALAGFPKAKMEVNKFFVSFDNHLNKRNKKLYL